MSNASELGKAAGTATLEKRGYRAANLLEMLIRAAAKTGSPQKAVSAAKAAIKPVEHINPFSFMKSPSMPGFGRFKPGVSGSWPDKVGPRFKFLQDLGK